MSNAGEGKKKTDINNINSNYRKIVSENNSTVNKVIGSFFLLYLFIGFSYDFVIKFFTLNVDKHYKVSQGYEKCIDCYVSWIDIISGILTFKYIPHATLTFLAIALLSLIYAKWSYKRVMFMGLEYGLVSGSKELFMESGDEKKTRELFDEERQLLNIVEEMKVASMLNYLPEVFVYNDDYPNSFSFANGDRTGFIAISSGAIALLPRDELSVLIAHEMAHIKCEDNKVAYYVDTLSHTLDFVLDMVTEVSYWLMRTSGASKSSDSNNNSGAVVLLASLCIFILTLFFRLVVPCVTFTLKKFLKEGADLRADGLAMKFTRDPLALHNLLNRQHDYNYDKELHDSPRNHSCFFFSESRSWISKKLFPNKPLLMMKRFNNTIKDVELYNKEKEQESTLKEDLEKSQKIS